MLSIFFYSGKKGTIKAFRYLSVTLHANLLVLISPLCITLHYIWRIQKNSLLEKKHLGQIITQTKLTMTKFTSILK